MRHGAQDSSQNGPNLARKITTSLGIEALLWRATHSSQTITRQETNKTSTCVML